MHPAPPFPPMPYLPPPLAGAPVGVPVGTIVSFAGAMGPGSLPIQAQGWMVCDGTSLSTTQYNELFAVIGYQWSSASQQNGPEFAIPDLQGYFLRGVTGTTNHDPDAGSRVLPDGTSAPQVGSLQQCALQVHQHDYDEAQTETTVADEGPKGLVSVSSQPTGDPIPEDITSPNETRPVNVYVYYLIKFTSRVFPALLPQAQRLGF